MTESETSSLRSAEFLKFAQAAGGFGVFELNLVTGAIQGTSLFFELIGLECDDMCLSRENGSPPSTRKTWKVSCQGMPTFRGRRAHSWKSASDNTHAKI